MPRQRLDPEHSDAVMFGAKFGRSDADRVIELSRQDGVGYSEFIRSAVLREIEQRADGPPEDE